MRNLPDTLNTSAVAGKAGQAARHESAPLHVAGAALYTDDIAAPAGMLYAYVGLS
jgi:xanthine dehydrogenase large subunit